MDIKSVSEHAYVIKKVNRESQARYAKPYQVGDKITFSTIITRTTAYRVGNRPVLYKLYNNGVEVATVTQNELVKVFQIFDVDIDDPDNHTNEKKGWFVY